MNQMIKRAKVVAYRESKKDFGEKKISPLEGGCFVFV